MYLRARFIEPPGGGPVVRRLREMCMHELTHLLTYSITYLLTCVLAFLNHRAVARLLAVSPRALSLASHQLVCISVGLIPTYNPYNSVGDNEAIHGF